MKTSSKLKLIKGLTIALCCGVFTANLMASPLADAKNAGHVKEMPDGYVATQGSASADIGALVKSINQRRKTAYEKIAKQHGIAVDQVGRESYTKRHPGN
ncbi:MAG: DUF1318 domain-containing protein [Gammaproteobacteria bacterium]|nr:DUF1318 domain-containing protein [Gammaproteobacteria bacterium]